MLKKYSFVVTSFLVWRLLLVVFLSLAMKFVPLQDNFIGGGHENYLRNPLLWSGVNFDGEHYLTISQNGYQPLTYFFFPVYPTIVSFFGNFLGGDIETLSYIGIIISHVSFLLALIGIWKLTLIDFNEKVARLVILTILLFPTSFFFISFYTESFFLMLAVWSFYCFQRKQYFLATVFGGISSATRVIGSIIAVSFFTDFLKRRKYRLMVYLPIVFIGMLLYMYYLKIRTGDPFEFFNTISIFGQQRSSQLVLLPQVFYRYFFKILPNLNYSYFPSLFTTYLELVSAILFFSLSILAFCKKNNESRILKIDYAVYLFLGFLIPTFAGSFSSMPRYVLVLFPGFILLSTFIVKWPRTAKLLYFLVSLLGLGIATAFFVRGIWIA